MIIELPSWYNLCKTSRGSSDKYGISGGQPLTFDLWTKPISSDAPKLAALLPHYYQYLKAATHFTIPKKVDS